jgi:prenyltransferase beta subunit
MTKDDFVAWWVETQAGALKKKIRWNGTKSLRRYILGTTCQKSSGVKVDFRPKTGKLYQNLWNP